MVLVAGGIASVLQEQLTVGTTLRELRRQEAVFLGGIDTTNKSFLCLEVERHRVVLVGVVSHLKHRSALDHAQGIDGSVGINQTGVQVHVNLVTFQIHILVVHLGITVQVGIARSSLVGHGVFGRILHRGVDTVLALTVQAVHVQGVVNGLVALIDQQLQRVHLRGIHSHSGLRHRICRDVIRRCIWGCHRVFHRYRSFTLGHVAKA